MNVQTRDAITTINPATGEAIERIARTSGADLDETLAQADARYRAWREAPVEDRAQLFFGIARALRSERASLAQTAVREMGKPIDQANAEIEKCATCCEYFAQQGPAMLADLAMPSNASRSYAAFRPLGVILAVMPWNFPYWQVFRAAVPALMAGNTMLLKHAENTTRCGLEIERIFQEAGAPRGLFATIVVEHDAAERLLADERIVAATLTGSERAGVAIARAAGTKLKKTVLELGGSDPFIVLGDADLDAAVRLAVAGRFQNNGQSCIAAKRFIIESSAYDEFAARFAEAARAQRVGDPMDEATELGPLARADLMKTLHEQVRETLEAGATLLSGGRPIDRAGNFYEATVVGDVVPGMRMFDEETFGPAAALVRARNEREAIALANRSSYGLGASIHSRDTQRAERLASHIEAGMVFVNGIVASDPRLPFGGRKRSGHGRELSHFGIHEFTNIQTVWVGLGQ
ncbi:MAG TPA: NAD-dependent succinate-semialdehyde dehydrogenase [Candidatus Aquilonibacter sp.]|nr:NAD-dependent succinate-semialdehyde dehydrogenase [Candidatus Aquilonibacter sp.]